MSIPERYDAASILSIKERLAATRTQMAALRPQDVELRRQLRHQLDDMLTELLGAHRANGPISSAPLSSALPVTLKLQPPSLVAKKEIDREAGD